MQIWKRVIIAFRDEWKCRYCGKDLFKLKLCFDHVFPKSLGGTDEIENMVVSCVGCNSKKKNKVLSDRRIEIIMKKSESLAIQEKDFGKFYTLNQAHLILKKSGDPRSLSWLKSRVYIGKLRSLKFYSQRLVYKDDIDSMKRKLSI